MPLSNSQFRQRYFSFLAVVLLALVTTVVVLKKSFVENDNRRPLFVFVADSLNVPFQQVERVHEAANPDTNLIVEPSGSVLAGRKIEHGRHCDVLVVADNRVIDSLSPKYVNWRVDFATNEIVLAGTQMSKYINEIDSDNWIEILLKDDVQFGRAHPGLDPCGYFTLLAWKLADAHYKGAGFSIYKRLLEKSPDKGRYLREDAHKLLSLVETTGGIDYVFVYRSQAVDHLLRIVELPPQINLGHREHEENYSKCSIKISGPDGKAKEIRGKPITYSLSILKICRDQDRAENLVRFLTGEAGRKILSANGQPPIVPANLKRLSAGQIPDFGSAVKEVQTP